MVANRTTAINRPLEQIWNTVRRYWGAYTSSQLVLEARLHGTLNPLVGLIRLRVFIPCAPTRLPRFTVVNWDGCEVVGRHQNSFACIGLIWTDEFTFRYASGLAKDRLLGAQAARLSRTPTVQRGPLASGPGQFLTPHPKQSTSTVAPRLSRNYPPCARPAMSDSEDYCPNSESR